VSGPSLTSYQAAVSSRTPWPWDTPTRIQDFADGISNTLMLFGVHDPEVEWTRPKDLTLNRQLTPFKMDNATTLVLIGLGSRRCLQMEAPDSSPKTSIPKCFTPC